MSPGSAAIYANNLTKVFKTASQEKVAVENISFRLEQGQSVAFLGANGAGKSTTIKMLCGILTPTRGEARILGETAGTIEANRKLGLVFGARSQLFMHMTVQQSLELSAEIYAISGKVRGERIANLASFFEIKHLLGRRARSLSLGERMRCEIVASLLHNPAVLLADEPTIGLDLVAKNHLRALLRRWQKTEKTALMLTSHDISDIEALCDRCILVENGKIEFDGLLADLKGPTKLIRRIRVQVSEGAMPPVAGLPGVRLFVQDGEFSRIYEVDLGQVGIDRAIAVVCAHYRDVIQDIQIEEIPLEDVLRRLLERSVTGNEG